MCALFRTLAPRVYRVCECIRYWGMHTTRRSSTRVYFIASKCHGYIMCCCMGPQNQSVMDDISKRAITVAICFFFSTRCCPCKNSNTGMLPAHPKHAAVRYLARIWYVHCIYAHMGSCHAISISCAVLVGYSTRSKLARLISRMCVRSIGTVYGTRYIPALYCTRKLSNS